MEVEVIRSQRRRKTIEARMVGSTLEVLVPARLSRREEEQCVADMVERFERRRASGEIDLEARAATLARRYDLPRPAGVRWVDNQRRRWGSCTIDTRQIRVSAVLASYPSWVLDYVLVHEMAHLVEADHSATFHAIVSRYPKAERAEGFLIAKGMGDDVEATGGGPARDRTGAHHEGSTIDGRRGDAAEHEVADVADGADAIDVVAVVPPDRRRRPKRAPSRPTDDGFGQRSLF